MTDRDTTRGRSETGGRSAETQVAKADAPTNRHFTVAQALRSFNLGDEAAVTAGLRGAIGARDEIGGGSAGRGVT